MNNIFPLSILLILNLVLSQKIDEYPDFKNSDLAEINQNLDWKTLQETSGDLNSDGKPDKVIILESKDSFLEKRCADCKPQQNKARIILVLKKIHDSFKVIAQNNRFISRSDEGGMIPCVEPEISIENNELKIFYQYLRSNQTYIFKYDNNSLKINCSKYVSVQSASGNYVENIIDFKKQIVTIKNGHISTGPENDKIQTISFSEKSKDLEDFESMYSWEIVNNIFL